MPDLAGGPVDDQHPRGGPLRQRLLRNQLVGQVIVKICGPHQTEDVCRARAVDKRKPVRLTIAADRPH